MKSMVITCMVFLFTIPVFGQLKVFEQNEKFGYKDAAGNIIIPAQYTYADEFKKGIAAVTDSSGWAIINSLGNIILRPYIYDNGPDYFSEGLARFVHNGKIGFYDEAGNIKILPVYEFAEPFSKGYSIVYKDITTKTDGEHKWILPSSKGVIDKNGKLVVPMEYQEIDILGGGKFNLRTKTKSNTINNE